MFFPPHFQSHGILGGGRPVVSRVHSSRLPPVLALEFCRRFVSQEFAHITLSRFLRRTDGRTMTNKQTKKSILLYGDSNHRTSVSGYGGVTATPLGGDATSLLFPAQRGLLYRTRLADRNDYSTTFFLFSASASTVYSP